MSYMTLYLFVRHCGSKVNTTHDSSTGAFRRHLDIAHPHMWARSSIVYGERNNG